MRFKPVMLPGETEERRLFLASSVSHFLAGNYSRKVDRDYYANVRSFLGRYVKGGALQHAVDLKKLKPYTDEVWEMRVRFKPQARIFGFFLMCDCFVALRAKFRDDCGKDYAGKTGFDKARIDAINDWNHLFPGCAPHSCFPLNDCISGVV